MPRKIPAPFKRPSVTVEEGIARQWQHVSVTSIVPGDTVAELGTVGSVEWPMSNVVVLHNRMGDSKSFYADRDLTVFAFVPIRSLAE